jgi:hypothetical protein
MDTWKQFTDTFVKVYQPLAESIPVSEPPRPGRSRAVSNNGQWMQIAGRLQMESRNPSLDKGRFSGNGLLQ